MESNQSETQKKLKPMKKRIGPAKGGKNSEQKGRRYYRKSLREEGHKKKPRQKKRSKKMGPRSVTGMLVSTKAKGEN